MRPSGRTLTHMPLMIETVVVFRENDLLALMLTRLSTFAPDSNFPQKNN